MADAQFRAVLVRLRVLRGARSDHPLVYTDRTFEAALGGSGAFERTFRNLTYGAFRVPDQDIPDAAASSLRIDADVLAAYAGTYRFAS